MFAAREVAGQIGAVFQIVADHLVDIGQWQAGEGLRDLLQIQRDTRFPIR